MKLQANVVQIGDGRARQKVYNDYVRGFDQVRGCMKDGTGRYVKDRYRVDS